MIHLYEIISTNMTRNVKCYNSVRLDPIQLVSMRRKRHNDDKIFLIFFVLLIDTSICSTQIIFFPEKTDIPAPKPCLSGANFCGSTDLEYPADEINVRLT